METVLIDISGERFSARVLDDLAPATCALFRSMLPSRYELIHARWSGEACWVPLGDLDVQVPIESGITAPEPGQMLFYPGGISEAEILVPYGSAFFACKAGRLVGSPFLQIEHDLARFAAVGHQVLWTGRCYISLRAR